MEELFRWIGRPLCVTNGHMIAAYVAGQIAMLAAILFTDAL